MRRAILDQHLARYEMQVVTKKIQQRKKEQQVACDYTQQLNLDKEYTSKYTGP